MFFLLLGTFISVSSFCQPGIAVQALEKYKSWPRYNAILQFYRLNNQQFAGVGQPDLRAELQEVLHSSFALGLQEEDYQRAFIKEHKRGELLLGSADSIDADVHFIWQRSMPALPCKLLDLILFDHAQRGQRARHIPLVIQQTNVLEPARPFFCRDTNQLMDLPFRQWRVSPQRDHKVKLFCIMQHIN